MKAEELRIGNYIKSSTTDELIIVSAYTITQIVEHPWKAKPIKLTEDWLEKLGFTEKIINEHTLRQTIYQSKYYFISLIKLGDYFKLIIDGKIYRTTDFVHQLQNVFYALTGEEL
jgi:hypothetical protein